MGNAMHHLGNSPAGAHAKLIANALFTMQVAALAELLGFARRARLDLEALMEALHELPILGPAAKGAAAGMLAGTFEPMFPLRLAAKDLRYAIAQADAVGSDMPITRVAHQVFERAGAQSCLEQNLTAVAKLYVRE